VGQHGALRRAPGPPPAGGPSQAEACATGPYLLCRNRVADFSRWKAVLASHAAAHCGAGLRLVNIWPGVEEPNNVFFLFEVASLDQARAFIGDPEAAKAGETAGVIDGEYHFVEDAGGYRSPGKTEGSPRE
jgi:hypothetical protein